jgi:hypothetical protein
MISTAVSPQPLLTATVRDYTTLLPHSASPNKHWFGYQDLHHSADKIRTRSQDKLQKADLDAVKRHIDFSFPKRVVEDTEKFSIRRPSRIPPASIVASYHEYAQGIDHALSKLIDTYSISLHPSPACNCDGITPKPDPQTCPHWQIVLVVLPENFAAAESYLPATLGLRYQNLPIVIMSGRYDVSGFRPNRKHYPRPPPGASISHEDDDESTATLGGYVKGTISGRVYALSVGHFLFAKPLDSTTPISPVVPVGQGHRITSPSTEDYRAAVKELQERIATLDPIADALFLGMLNTTMKDYRQLGQGRYFGETSQAIWQLFKPAGEKYSTIIDLSLTRLTEDRQGDNELALPPATYLSAFILGTDDDKEGEMVYKVGRSTGFTTGYIAKNVTYHRHAKFNETIAFRTCKAEPSATLLSPGDSGALLINEKGKAIGLINGGLTAVQRLRDRDVEMNECTFIPMSVILEWVSIVLAEDVEFLTTV